MKKAIRISLALGTLMSLTQIGFSQNVGINTTGAAPNAAAILDLNTGNAGSMGLLPEQVALTATNAAGPVALPPTGLIVYNTATAGVSPNNVTPGYYYNAGTSAAPNWVQFVAGNSATTGAGGWLLNGNTGTNSAVNFLGTTDAQNLNFRTNNLQRMTILSNGNVGINVAGPTRLLDVEGASAGGGIIGYFLNSTNSGFGLFAVNSAAAGASTGCAILANNMQTGGTAIGGQLGNAVTTYYASTAVSGNVDASVAGGIGVEGVSGGGNGAGVFGSNSSTTGFGGYFVNSSSGSQPGAFGYGTNASGTGVAGTGNGLGFVYGIVGGAGASFAGNLIGVYCQYIANSTAGVAGVFQDGKTGGQADVNAWVGATHYKIISTYAGSVSCAVPDMNNKMVVMHCPETPEFYFEDYGDGQLVNGRIHITLDPVFAKNVAIINGQHPLRVFIQLENDTNCKGVVVANKTATGFDVIELGGGTSNTPFEWHVVCNAKDQPAGLGINRLQDLRFEPAPVPYAGTKTSVLTAPAAVQLH